MTQSPTSTSAGAAVLALVAPISGQMLPIEQVPDPVFAQKMVGDGISIDPLSQRLVAPCDGEVIQLHPSCHAVTLKTDSGLEVLMHIGLDTVTLRGQGFTPQVKVGDRVTTGDGLIEFDADYVATHARSLLTQIVITNSERVDQLVPCLPGKVTVGQDVVLEVVLAEKEITTAVQEDNIVTSEPIVVPNPTGLHARPAAVLANLAKQYQSTIKLHKGDQSANVRSVVSVMGLEVGFRDLVRLVATGSDAAAAIAALSAELRAGLGEEGAKPSPAPASMAQAEISQPAPRPRSDNPNLILGVAASPGVAVGTTYRLTHQEIQVAEVGGTPNEERRSLERALQQATLEIEALRAKVHGQQDAAKAAIFAAHLELLDDPELLDMATSAIDKGKSAASAWKQTYTHQAAQLAQLKNELLAARANDLRDVGGRVLRILTGATPATATYPANTILLAEDLTPSDTATMDRSKVLGFCTVGGGATSHVAILARSMDIPAIAGAEPRMLELPNGTPVILDGSKGTLQLHPTPEEMEQVRQRQLRLKERRERELASADAPAITQDGHRVEVVANIGSQADAEQAITLGTEGVGLLRSEFVFMERESAPSEDEQTELYASIAKVLGNRPLIIRTLDVGGDKPLPYLPIPHEENPFLGERGVRIGFDRPEILRTQLRAILRASRSGNVHVMFPMIARLEDWWMAKGMLDEEAERLEIPSIPAGIMVEVPATAIIADQFAKVVDFFSVGTNDLTQYTLAMDRGHPKLAAYADALHPGVLKLIGMAAQAANQHGKWCGVCGGVASDPQAVPLLIGLGVKELSVSVPTIPSIKAQVRELILADCQTLAAQAIACNTAAEVRALTINHDQ
ncbi:phosphoenolpyruvate--protein phosphotransferase [Pantanalinema sp. GBBB05]|uniref:phosphoenolpyruvate--protein phosphotransferase n=1 Tax=Pantanalinema sp. GBBB05 TaxID=2604139 RepID=UPI001D4E42DA|nr:phosphoenolpyruvate--protein phosphotransferase [Pantanalinema sp. GBBB05]